MYVMIINTLKEESFKLILNVKNLNLVARKGDNSEKR